MKRLGEKCDDCDVKLEYVSASFPYSPEHLMCPECDGTYVLDDSHIGNDHEIPVKVELLRIMIDTWKIYIRELTPEINGVRSGMKRLIEEIEKNGIEFRYKSEEE